MESDEKIKNLAFISVVWVSFKSTQVLFIHIYRLTQATKIQYLERGHLKQEEKNSICSQNYSNFRLNTYIDHIIFFFFSPGETWLYIETEKKKHLLHGYIFSKSRIQLNEYPGNLFA